ncbi:MAG: hypothetical protein WAV38_29000, partial [Xanthobacteraceae bacterium]
MPKRLTVLNVAYPFAPVGPDTAGGAEQVLSAIDRALVAAGHRSLVVGCAGSQISGEIMLMHFALHLGGARALASTLEDLVAAVPERGKLADLIDLAAANSDHLTQVTELVEGGLADLAAAGSGGVGAIRALFDGAVAIAPEASVALYSLG